MANEESELSGLISEIRGLRSAVGGLRRELGVVDKRYKRRWQVGVATVLMMLVVIVMLVIGYFQLFTLENSLRAEVEERVAANCESIATTRETVRDVMVILVEAANRDREGETPAERREREARSQAFLDRINARLEGVTCE